MLSSCANCAQRGHCVHAKLGEACEDHIFQQGGADLRGLTDDEAQAIADQFSIETTKYTVFRIWAIAQSKVQRGGAVVVAELTDRDLYDAWLKCDYGLEEEPIYHEGVRDGYKLVVSRIQPIPADRVLADGMVGVDREERDLLGHLHMVAMQFVMDADPAQRRSAAHLVQAVAALRQHESRSAKGEGK